MTQHIRITEAGSLGDLEIEEGAFVRCPIREVYKNSVERTPTLSDGYVYGWLNGTTPDSANDIKVNVVNSDFTRRTRSSNYFDADALEVVAPPLEVGDIVRGSFPTIYSGRVASSVPAENVIDLDDWTEPWFRGELQSLSPDPAGDVHVDIGAGIFDIFRWALVPEQLAVGIPEVDTPPRGGYP